MWQLGESRAKHSVSHGASRGYVEESVMTRYPASLTFPDLYKLIFSLLLEFGHNSAILGSLKN